MLFASSNQEAVDLHVQAFALAERLSLPVMVCMDGFVLTHAVEEIDVPEQDQVDAYLPPFAAAAVARPGRPGHDRGDGRPGGLHRGQVPDGAPPARARSTSSPRSPRSSPTVRRDSGGLVRPYRAADADVVVVALGSVLGTARGRRRRPARRGRRGRRPRCHVLPPLARRRGARRARATSHASIVLNRAVAVGPGSILGQDVRLSAPAGRRVHDVVVGLGGRPVTRTDSRAAGARRRAGRVEHRRPCTSSTSTRTAAAKCRRAGRRHRARRRHDHDDLKLYQIGTFAAGNRLLDPERTVRPVRPPTAPTRSPRATGPAAVAARRSAARFVLDAAMRATDGRLVTVNATGCLEVFSTPYPESAWQVPWLHSLFGNAAAVASGVAAALRATGRDDIRVVAQAGDGGTVDIGLGCLSGMFERNDDVLFVCYDNQGYMNTGVQRSGATPPAASTATTRPVARRDRQRVRHRQEPAAHRHGTRDPATSPPRRWPTCTTSRPRSAQAMSMHGARYLHVLVPCPLGWGSARRATPCGSPGWRPRAGSSRSSRPSTATVTQVTPDPAPVPVDEYLQPAGALRPPVRRARAARRGRRPAGPR